MKRLHNYIILSVLAIAFASCSEEQIIDNKNEVSADGNVQFGLSLAHLSRTVYGDEVGNAFPIYWVNGDKVQIFSPQALEGRRNAEYQVSVDKPKNFADNLTKTGDYGVQWGTGYTVDETPGYHDFYSLYPSGNYTLSTDGTKAENITINSMQNIVVNGGVVKSDMEDCLMYAKTTGVAKGEVVNLQYNPITTVLMVKVKVAANQTGTDPDKFTIQYIKLEADTDIAGTFSLNISDGSFAGFAENKVKNIQADIVNNATGGYHSISNGEYLEIPLFLAPTFTVNEDETVKGPNVKNWKISILANGNIYTKTLNIDKTLTPGQIHKITLPELAPAATEWDVAKWMTYIPRNVYLSEVSIPGSWNTINSDYQSKTSILDQYNVGVRAFHFDTRWRTSDTSVGLTGNLGGTINGLSVAGGAESGKYNGGDRVVSGNAKTFKDYLKDITDNVKPDEYMVLMCTFAQDSYEYSGDHGDWAGEISYQCSENTSVYDAKKLNSNTLVGDVLGSVIVIVNMEGSFTEVASDSKCLFVNMPLTLTSDLFASSLTDKNKGKIYKAIASGTSVEESGIEMYHTQAQISLEASTTRDRNNVMDRGFAPTYDERKTVANNILEWSKSNYGTDNYKHDKWIYLGLGGYYAQENTFLGTFVGWEEKKGSNSTVASQFNAWINGKVTEMGNETTNVPYYPVGIVLMNFTNDYDYTVKNILMLNNKYRLQFDPNKPSNYDPNNKNQDDFDGTFEEETDDEDPFA